MSTRTNCCPRHSTGESETRYPDKSVKLRNPHIKYMDNDVLYHLALGSGSHNLVKMFGDVKFICTGGTDHRMEAFANFIMKEIKYELPTGTTLLNLTQNGHRFAMYKVGPVLCVSHGMGVPSLSILLHEIIKLAYHAKMKDPVIFRIGTCGGIGLEGGTVIVSDKAVDPMLNDYHEMPILGDLVRRPAILDQDIVRELKNLSKPDDPFVTTTGTTMCTSDFYEGQGRLDGAFCEYHEAAKMEYLRKIHAAGVVNIEMEATLFASLTHYAGIRSGIVCVAYLDRLQGDQVLGSIQVLDEWQLRPQILVGRYIKKQLNIKD